jgi:protein-L-isoaspartate(D-aspartate) O-methyltransferase
LGGVQDRNGRLRLEMAEQLKNDRVLTDPRVEATLLQVPRHVFLPGTDLAAAYTDEAVVRHHKDGLPASSASQPAIVAAMLEQLNSPAGRPGVGGRRRHWL